MNYCVRHNFTYMEPTCPMCEGRTNYYGILGDATQQALSGVAFGSATITDATGFVVKPEPSIGDLNSDAKGSGARFNAGKVPYELIAWKPFALALAPHSDGQAYVRSALIELGEFQAGGGDHELHKLLDYTRMACGLSVPGFCQQTAHVLDFGKRKYAEWNWAKGMLWSVPIACIARHLLGTDDKPGMWQDQSLNDPESGCMHAGHVGCNALFLLQYMLTYRDGDDRPKMLQEAPF